MVKYYFIILALFNCIHSSANVYDTLTKDKLNLALRQAVHDLMLDQGDSTTSIDPIHSEGCCTFRSGQLALSNYNSLPHLLDKALTAYNLDLRYEVIIRDCEEQSILLGYNYIAFDSENIPCKERHDSIPCGIIEFHFDHFNSPALKQESPLKTSNISSLTYSLLMVGLLLLVFYAFVKWEDWSNNTTSNNTETVKIGHLLYYPSKTYLQTNDGQKSTQLTYRENKLFHLLVQSKNQVIQREVIMQEVWEDEGLIVGRSLDVFISRLRKIISIDPTLAITNIRGVGYKLEEQTAN